jgi:hypothetical protein
VSVAVDVRTGPVVDQNVDPDPDLKEQRDNRYCFQGAVESCFVPSWELDELRNEPCREKDYEEQAGALRELFYYGRHRHGDKITALWRDDAGLRGSPALPLRELVACVAVTAAPVRLYSFPEVLEDESCPAAGGLTKLDDGI